MSNSSQRHELLQHARLSYPSLSPRVCLNSCPLSQWCYLTISSSVAFFSCCLQSLPASESFPMKMGFPKLGKITIISKMRHIDPTSFYSVASRASHGRPVDPNEMLPTSRAAGKAQRLKQEGTGAFQGGSKPGSSCCRFLFMNGTPGVMQGSSEHKTK